MKRLKLASLICLFPLGVQALELVMPTGSILAVDKVSESGSYALPDGPFAEGFLSTRQINGFVSRQVWSYASNDITTDQLIDPLRQQIQSEGYAVLLDCDAESCGGFDFRFATEVLPAPDMFVDLSDYRFLAALRDTSDGFDAISVLVSRSGEQGLTQLIAVQPGPNALELPLAKPDISLPIATLADADPTIPTEVIKALTLGGHVILRDLNFETGSSQLASGSYASLLALSNYLQENTATKIALVGHTDSVGALEGNLALSQKRAQAVQSYLVNQLGVSANQLEARGVGYLAPIAANTSQEGRTANRRVEAILLTSE